MSILRLFIWTLLISCSASGLAQQAKSLRVDTGPDRAAPQRPLPDGSAALVLRGPEDVRQIIVTSITSDGKAVDATRSCNYAVLPKELALVELGFVHPLANGTGVIKVHDPVSGLETDVSLQVESIEATRAISFPNDIVPLFTRAGCNSGTCHGTPSGKNNFRLSLLGFEPEQDYEFLSHEARGRRVLPLAPERSLLLLKASGEVAHGGGARMEAGTPEFRLVSRWVADGMPYRPTGDPVVQSIEVFPSERVVGSEGSQQLRVTAQFSDGSTRDITRVAQYKANQPDMCQVDEHGWVQFSQRTGTTSVMVRYQDQVTAFMATIPLGKVVDQLPQPANFIDRLVFEKLQMLGLPPSELCDDQTFLRRVCLDLTGRLPTIEQTQQFMQSDDPQRRGKLIDQLLDSPAYAEWFAGKWASILRNKAGTNLEQVARETFAFHSWIQSSLDQNISYAQFATELITARGNPATSAPVSWYRAVKDPKDQMADIAQVFLGVRIQCAQCHHHPYEKWTQDDYYGFAAFFSTLKRKEIRKRPEEDALYHSRELATFTNPDSGEQLRPTPLDSPPIDIPPRRDPRVDLADWMTNPENPFFAKMLVNRYWKHFFGRGLVEPEDDLRITNPPTHPRLLAGLAQSFSASGFDLKELCRSICNSSTYQLSSIPNDDNLDDEQNFARYYPRRLTAEVMLDAMNDVALSKNSFNHQPLGVRAVALPDDSVNQQSFFLRIFGRPQMDTACECERTNSADLSQSLHLINSDTMQQILATSTGRAVQLARDKQRDDQAKITEIYLQALSRSPTEEELNVGLQHLEKKRKLSEADSSKLSPEQASREALEDLIWVVINTKEFLFNH